MARAWRFRRVLARHDHHRGHADLGQPQAQPFRLGRLGPPTQFDQGLALALLVFAPLAAQFSDRLGLDVNRLL